jgi:hypothetical protein
MGIKIFEALCVAAEGFLIFVLVNFGRESKRTPKQAVVIYPPVASTLKQRIAPLELVGPVSSAVWSSRTWRRSVSDEPLSPANLSQNGRANSDANSPTNTPTNTRIASMEVYRRA